MKKIISLCMALCILFACSACTTDSEPTVPPTAIPDTDPTTTTPTEEPSKPTEPETTEPSTPELEYNLPMIAISVTEETEITSGKDGNPVFEYTYPNIRLILPDPEMSMQVNLDILNRIDATRSVANDLMNDAVAENPKYPYTLTVIYEPQRVDSSIISLFASQSIYSGGSVFHSGHGITYDLSTGNLLTLGDVLNTQVSADDLCPLVAKALSSLPEEYAIFDDFITTVEHRFAVDFRADAGWHLSEEGLCFTFLPYEVAPNSTGFVHAMIPYDQLNGILCDAYYPPEEVTAKGELEVLPDHEDTENYSQVASLNLDPVGDHYLLHCTDLIYNLKIETGFWSMDGTTFTPQRIVFLADSLIPGDAVKIQTDIPDTLPHLRITYTGSDGMVTVYLSTSGKDGTPLLLTY